MARRGASQTIPYRLNPIAYQQVVRCPFSVVRIIAESLLTLGIICVRELLQDQAKYACPNFRTTDNGYAMAKLSTLLREAQPPSVRALNHPPVPGSGRYRFDDHFVQGPRYLAIHSDLIIRTKDDRPGWLVGRVEARCREKR